MLRTKYRAPVVEFPATRGDILIRGFWPCCVNSCPGIRPLLSKPGRWRREEFTSGGGRGGQSPVKPVVREGKGIRELGLGQYLRALTLTHRSPLSQQD